MDIRRILLKPIKNKYMYHFFKNKKKNMQDEKIISSLEENESPEGLLIENTTEETLINESQLIEDELEIISGLNQKLLNMEKEVMELKEQNLRLQADFVNFRKRKEKEMSETIVFANEGLIKQLLPILDDFDRTLKAIENSDNLTAIKEGIGMVAKNVRTTLQRVGLETVNAIGEEFNPAFHDAITMISVEEEDKKGRIFDEIEKGYMLKDKVIRPSKVIIGE